jgi:peptidoglycan/xylan/chitin deacetylase (PgdA/CDA1 family)
MMAAQVLKNHGFRGTFFINSGFMGAPGYMTVENLHSLVGDGNEIGGHTTTLADLTALEPDESARQVCNDRANLTDWGFRSPLSPTPSTQPHRRRRPLSRTAGTTAPGAREASAAGWSTCDVAETVRPADPFNTRSTPEIGSAWTIEDLQQTVMAAETKGGWLQLDFHDIADDGGPRSVRPPLFSDFVEWLGYRTEQGTTAVRTVHDVIGGGAKPAFAGPVVPPAAAD